MRIRLPPPVAAQAPARAPAEVAPAEKFSREPEFGHRFGDVPSRAEKIVVQAQRSLGASGDAWERAADGAARRIVHGGAVGIDGVAGRTRLPRPSGPVAPALESRITQARGGGASLPAPTRARMEHGFGVDFARVRVHADVEADRLSHALGASAFTTGRDLFFSRGTYQPATPAGQELIAHELAHVVQQSDGDAGDRIQRHDPFDKHLEDDAKAKKGDFPGGTVHHKVAQTRLKLLAMLVEDALKSADLPLKSAATALKAQIIKCRHSDMQSEDLYKVLNNMPINLEIGPNADNLLDEAAATFDGNTVPGPPPTLKRQLTARSAELVKVHRELKESPKALTADSCNRITAALAAAQAAQTLDADGRNRLTPSKPEQWEKSYDDETKVAVYQKKRTDEMEQEGKEREKRTPAAVRRELEAQKRRANEASIKKQDADASAVREAALEFRKVAAKFPEVDAAAMMPADGWRMFDWELTRKEVEKIQRDSKMKKAKPRSKQKAPKSKLSPTEKVKYAADKIHALLGTKPGGPADAAAAKPAAKPAAPDPPPASAAGDADDGPA